MISRSDSKGRIYIPKEFQSKLTKEVYIVEFKEGLFIVPIPVDPLLQLQTEGKLMGSHSLAELKKIIEAEAANNVSTTNERDE
jgi:DNA-binding transcriptional regulator/RsmH inhibitor MraZ